MNKCPYCGTGTDTMEDGTRYYECGTTYHIQSGDVEQSDTCKKDAK